MTTKDKYIQKLEELNAEQRKLIYELDKQPNSIGKEWRERVEGIQINVNDLKSELSALKAEMEKEEKPKYDYAKIRKAGLKKYCISGISCNLCEVANHSAFRQCFIDSYNSEFASDEELEKLGLIDG